MEWVGGVWSWALGIWSDRLGMGGVRLGVSGVKEGIQGARVDIGVLGLGGSCIGLCVFVTRSVICGMSVGVWGGGGNLGGIGLGSSAFFVSWLVGHGVRVSWWESKCYLFNLLTYVFSCIWVIWLWVLAAGDSLVVWVV